MRPLIDPALEAYVFEHTKPALALFDELREETYGSMQAPQMQVGRVEGALLRMLVSLSGAKNILEIGTFTGYSALAMGGALPADGKLISCDRDPAATAMARRYFDKSGYGDKLEIRLGDALETVRGLDGIRFDLLFLDADKARYVDYYEAAFDKLNPGALILADNALWSGTVIHPETDDARGIAAFNAHVVKDPRVDCVMLAVRDGIMMARKL